MNEPKQRPACWQAHAWWTMCVAAVLLTVVGWLYAHHELTMAEEQKARIALDVRVQLIDRDTAVIKSQLAGIAAQLERIEKKLDGRVAVKPE